MWKSLKEAMKEEPKTFAAGLALIFTLIMLYLFFTNLQTYN